MTVSEAKGRQLDIKNCQRAMEILQKSEKAEFYRDMLGFSIVLLEEYRQMLNDKIEKAEI